MLKSEKRSLIRFLMIYLISTFLLFSLSSWIFYSSSKSHIIEQQRETIKYEADRIFSQLRILHQSNDKILFYPNERGISSAIYDLDRHYIFGTFKKPPTLDQIPLKDSLYFLKKIEPYYLGVAYLLVERKIDYRPIEQLQKRISLFMLGGGVFFTILGFFLGRLFIAPMRESIAQMNRFIQDTTHELNTPISTILTNIEMIETLKKCPDTKEELQRIAIASQTLSRIYDDLTYLNLNHEYHRNIVDLNMSHLVRERIAYVGAMAESKALEVTADILPDVHLMIDRNDALRLIDNLLSNAIKYNRPKGELTIRLDQSSLVVEDSGSGIEKRHLRRITERFRRANKSEGGFGIGLDIVSQVVQSYDFTWSIDSTPDIGTKVTIKWKK